MTRERIHFITGRLAEFALSAQLERLAPLVGFDYTLQVLPITVAALIALNRPDQLRFHLGRAVENGLKEQELIETITHLAFYAGWPCAMTAASNAESTTPASPSSKLWPDGIGTGRQRSTACKSNTSWS